MNNIQVIYFYFLKILMNHRIVKHVCSLGSLCHSSELLKVAELKKCSYPFDWIFSSYDMVIHCIEDNFKMFMDKSYYIDIKSDKCGHKHYHEELFNHRNPLRIEEDYAYYERCISRFQNLLRCKDEHKLFLVMNVNMSEVTDADKAAVVDFNNKLSMYTTNYTLLVVFNVVNKPVNSYECTRNGNIDFLELHTLTSSRGVRFINDDDNEYLKNVILTKCNYLFQ